MKGQFTQACRAHEAICSLHPTLQDSLNRRPVTPTLAACALHTQVCSGQSQAPTWLQHQMLCHTSQAAPAASKSYHKPLVSPPCSDHSICWSFQVNMQDAKSRGSSTLQIHSCTQHNFCTTLLSTNQALNVHVQWRVSSTSLAGVHHVCCNVQSSHAPILLLPSDQCLLDKVPLSPKKPSSLPPLTQTLTHYTFKPSTTLTRPTLTRPIL